MISAGMTEKANSLRNDFCQKIPDICRCTTSQTSIGAVHGILASPHCREQMLEAHTIVDGQLRPSSLISTAIE